MTKRVAAVFCTAFMALSLLTGCKKTTRVEYIDEESGASVISTSGSAAEASGGTESGDTTGTSQGEDATTSAGINTLRKTNSVGTATTKAAGPNRTKPTANKNNRTFIVPNTVGKDTNADYKVSGQVSVLVDVGRVTDSEGLFDKLKELYPNVDLKIVTFDHTTEEGGVDTAEYRLNLLWASNNMPDIIFDEAGPMPSYVTRGYCYPLDSFVKDDPDFKNYVPANLKSDYTYGGKLYAIPFQAHFGALLLNEDAIKANNIKHPALDWTFEDFETFLRAGSNATYSGTENLFGLEDWGFINGSGLYGYDKASQTFNGSSLVQAASFMRKLRAIPQLEAWSLRDNPNNTTAASEYAKKFPGGDLSNAHMAWNMGRTLMNLENMGTWVGDRPDYYTAFKAKLWPLPQASGHKGQVPLHVDHCFMSSTTKNPKAAFEILRYLTYSLDGNMVRLSTYADENKGYYALNSKIYYPTTTHPEIVKKFNSLSAATEVDKYFYQNIGKGIRMDAWKTVYQIKEIHAEYIVPTQRKVTDSQADPSALNAAASQANAAMKKAQSDFDARVKKAQADFDKTH